MDEAMGKMQACPNEWQVGEGAGEDVLVCKVSGSCEEDMGEVPGIGEVGYEGRVKLCLMLHHPSSTKMASMI